MRSSYKLIGSMCCDALICLFAADRVVARVSTRQWKKGKSIIERSLYFIDASSIRVCSQGVSSRSNFSQPFICMLLPIPLPLKKRCQHVKLVALTVV
jgi:hypothetical protein